MRIDIASFVAIRSATLIQTQRIHPTQRFRCILIQVPAAFQPYRVLNRKPSHLGIVVTEQIVMQTGFAVRILARIAQGLMGQGRLLCQPGKALRLSAHLAKAAVLAAAADVAAFIGYLQRCPVEIGIEPQHIAPDAIW
ncbi:hypothetical protein SZ66_06100 [Pantoea ananatis]|nr:hypothetical protein [Pantoea ananatis]